MVSVLQRLDKRSVILTFVAVTAGHGSRVPGLGALFGLMTFSS